MQDSCARMEFEHYDQSRIYVSFHMRNVRNIKLEICGEILILMLHKLPIYEEYKLQT